MEFHLKTQTKSELVLKGGAHTRQHGWVCQDPPRLPWPMRSGQVHHLWEAGICAKVWMTSDFPSGSDNAGYPGSIPGSGRSPGEGNGTPLQYSCLENPIDRGAWWATVHGVAKSRARLSDFTFTLKVSTFRSGREGHEENVPWPLKQALRQELTSRSILDSRSFGFGLRNDVRVGVILHLDHKVTVLLKLRVAKDPIQCSFQITILMKQNIFTMYAVPRPHYILTIWSRMSSRQGRKPEFISPKWLWVRGSDPVYEMHFPWTFFKSLNWSL